MNGVGLVGVHLKNSRESNYKYMEASVALFFSLVQQIRADTLCLEGVLATWYWLRLVLDSEIL